MVLKRLDKVLSRFILVTCVSLSLRLQCVLQAMCACLSADSGLQTVSECVSVLTSMCDHLTLAQQLCSQHGEAPPPDPGALRCFRLSPTCLFLFSSDPCVFLKLFQFIRARTDNQVTNGDWIQLDLQVNIGLTAYSDVVGFYILSLIIEKGENKTGVWSRSHINIVQTSIQEMNR